MTASAVAKMALATFGVAKMADAAPAKTRPEVSDEKWFKEVFGFPETKGVEKIKMPVINSILKIELRQVSSKMKEKCRERL